MSDSRPVKADPAAIRALCRAWVDFNLDLTHAYSELRNVLDEVSAELESVPQVVSATAELAGGGTWTADQLDPIRVDLINRAQVLEQYLRVGASRASADRPEADVSSVTGGISGEAVSTTANDGPEASPAASVSGLARGGGGRGGGQSPPPPWYGLGDAGEPARRFGSEGRPGWSSRQHVTRGELRPDGKSLAGYHSRPRGVDVEGFIFDGSTRQEVGGGAYSGRWRILDASGRPRFKPNGGDLSKFSTFWPDSWSLADIEEAIADAYDDAVAKGTVTGMVFEGVGRGFHIFVKCDADVAAGGTVVTAFPSAYVGGDGWSND
ncbi:EndoU domain-containing protein [Geodermatophilus sp. SYSU D01119]